MVTAILWHGRNLKSPKMIAFVCFVRSPPSYRPETELISHYFHARLPDQFDGILHYDHTRAVEPLERTAEWEAGEMEETFPSGL
jgi:hypothetical protein